MNVNGTSLLKSYQLYMLNIVMNSLGTEDEVNHTRNNGPLDALTRDYDKGPIYALTRDYDKGPLDALTRDYDNGQLDALTRDYDKGPLDALTRDYLCCDNQRSMCPIVRQHLRNTHTI